MIVLGLEQIMLEAPPNPTPGPGNGIREAPQPQMLPDGDQMTFSCRPRKINCARRMPNDSKGHGAFGNPSLETTDVGSSGI